MHNQGVVFFLCKWWLIWIGGCINIIEKDFMHRYMATPSKFDGHTGLLVLLNIVPADEVSDTTKAQ